MRVNTAISCTGRPGGAAVNLQHETVRRLDGFSGSDLGMYGHFHFLDTNCRKRFEARVNKVERESDEGRKC